MKNPTIIILFLTLLYSCGNKLENQQKELTNDSIITNDSVITLDTINFVVDEKYLNNTTDWKVGDIVECVKTGIDTELDTFLPPPVHLNRKYIVQDIDVCKCGNVSLDVGIYVEEGVTCECGAISSSKSGIWWVSEKRFKKISTL